MAKSCVWLVPWAAYPQKVGWIDRNDIILRPIKFAGTKNYSYLADCNFNFLKNFIVNHILGLMFSQFFENISIPRSIMTF